MPTGLLGVAIGNDNLKITSCTGASPVSFVSSRLPENLIKNNHIVSDDVFTGFFKETLKTNKISTRDCALVLPTDSCYIKRVKLPLMTPAQLAVNLPFEFHDYITENTGDYLYDYAVISKDEKNLDLMAAAFSKKDSLEYQQVFKASGRRLVRIVPDAICLQNILQRSAEPDRDYAILDLGHIQSRLHFFRGGYFEITRIMDFGGSTLAKTIADDQGIDTHIAQLRLEQDDPDTLGLTAMTGQYDTYSTELMRVLNFYNYNHAGNSIDALYVCGGCSGISVLLDNIVNATGLRVRRVSELCTGLTEEQAEYVDKAPQCYGIMLQD